MTNIVIVGGNFAGVSTAHYLLRHVLPSLNSIDPEKEYRVILISPSDHTYWKIGAARVMTSPETVPIEKPFGSIIEAFSTYSPSEFTFIQGKVAALDEETKILSVNGTGSQKPISVQYESLVIATGSTSSPLWTLEDDYTITRAALEDMRKRLPIAKTVLVAGGGSTGVETAGDIAHYFKDKDITLYSGTTRVLPKLNNPSVSSIAERKLAELEVKVVHNIKVLSSTTLPDGRISVKLSDGSTKIVDIYINAAGGSPNTKFLPAKWLDEWRRVDTEISTLRVKNAPVGVYCLGDAASFARGRVFDTTYPVPAMCYSIWADLTEGQMPQGSAVLKEKKFKPIAGDMQTVPIGYNGGVGVVFGWRVPSWFVWLMKSRTFMLQNAAGLATGADFMKP